jgi:peptidoglycan/xylan/chitin deacetylase (PgdA/CDA1 family)
MLLILMFHQIYDPHQARSFEDQQAFFAQYLIDLKSKYPIIRPGEPCQKNKLNICLCFDDAYYDFYQLVYPILKQLEIPAVLAIPTGAIQESTDLSNSERLAQLDINLETTEHPPAALCTWPEIKTMTDSQWVVPASHTHHHLNLQTIQKTDSAVLHFELQYSQQLIESQTQVPCQTFVYPFGSWNPAIQKIVSKYYLYNFRISHAINPAHWSPAKQLFYRVNADPFWKNHQFFSKLQLYQYSIKSWFNTLRQA